MPNQQPIFNTQVKEYVENNLEMLLKQYFKTYYTNPESLKQGHKKCFFCERPMKGFAKTLDDRLIKELWDIRLWCSINKTRQFNPREVWKGHEDYANLVADSQKLGYWNFIRKTKRSGWWFFTNRGRDFLNKRIQVPRVKWIFKNEVFDEEDDMVEVETADPRWQLGKVDYTSDYIFIKPKKSVEKTVDYLTKMYGNA